MKLAIPATGDTLDAQVDNRFGRCATYLLVDSETMEFQAMPNTAAQQGSGAGITAAQLVAESGAEGVIVGNLGPKAFQALSQGGLDIYRYPQGGTVKQVVQAFNAGNIEPVSGATTAAKSGMGGGMGRGGGMGMGRGGGMGTGRGGGMGGGRGQGMGGGAGMAGSAAGMPTGGAGTPQMPTPPQPPQQPQQQPPQQFPQAQPQPQVSADEIKQLKDQVADLQKKIQDLTDKLED